MIQTASITLSSCRGEIFTKNYCIFFILWVVGCIVTKHSHPNICMPSCLWILIFIIFTLLILLEFLMVVNPIVVLHFFNFWTNIMLPYSQTHAVFLSDGSTWNFPIISEIWEHVVSKKPKTRWNQSLRLSLSNWYQQFSSSKSLMYSYVIPSEITTVPVDVFMTTDDLHQESHRTAAFWSLSLTVTFLFLQLRQCQQHWLIRRGQKNM